MIKIIKTHEMKNESEVLWPNKLVYAPLFPSQHMEVYKCVLIVCLIDWFLYACQTWNCFYAVVISVSGNFVKNFAINNKYETLHTYCQHDCVLRRPLSRNILHVLQVLLIELSR